MKKIRKYGLLVGVLVLFTLGVRAQSQEAQQLILNVEKLSQLKNILKDMKKGYNIVSQGYKKVKDVASGNFSLHEVFLDGLMQVSPEVKKYRRVADIISFQQKIVWEYKTALRAFRGVDVFNESELDYLGNVYATLFDASLVNLEDLAMVITSSRLRMNEQERLSAIDRIFLDVSDKLEFLRGFNREAVALMRQKEKEKREIEQLKMYYGN